MADNVKNIADARKGEGGEQTNVTRLPSAAALKKQLKDYSALKSDMDSTRGDMGALVKDGEDTRNIHRAAFKLAAKLAGQDETKRAEFLAHFDHYRQVLGLNSGTVDMLRDDAAASVAAE